MTHHGTHLVALVASATLMLTACVEEPDPADEQDTSSDGSEDGTGGDDFEVLYVRSGLGADQAIDEDAVATLVNVNTTSALLFHSTLRAHAGGANFTFSPFGISRTFSGYYDPARTDVAPAFEHLFGFTGQTTSEQTWQMVTHETMHRDAVDGEVLSGFMSNDILWVDEVSTTHNNTNFDRVHALPLIRDPEGSRDVINAWITKHTSGLITDYFAEIPGATKAITSNVIYFKGPWANAFSETSFDFQGASATESIDAITGVLDARYARSNDATIVVVPFTDEYEFVGLMPDGALDAFTLDDATLDALESDLMYGTISVTLPSFSISTKPDLVRAIGELREASGTSGEGTLTGYPIESYAQEAIIALDHEGVEAAAATTVHEHNNTAPPEPSDTLTFDEPFVFMVRDGKSGSILFMGEFTNQ